eukprot:6479415-Amphidinium_carterae.1
MPPRFTPLWSLSLGGPPGGGSRDESCNWLLPASPSGALPSSAGVGSGLGALGVGCPPPGALLGPFGESLCPPGVSPPGSAGVGPGL